MLRVSAAKILRRDVGVVVPIPTKPELCWTISREVPIVKPPVEKVDVAAADRTVKPLLRVRVLKFAVVV